MKHLTRLAVLAATVAALLVSAASAGATTAPGYEEFEDCPSRTVNSGIGICQITEIVDGHITLGTKRTPIEDPITLTVGANPLTGETFLGSFDGGRQEVPGGLVGISGLDWLIYLFPNSLLGLYAETELAGPVGNAFAPRLSLPIKVHLENPLLTNDCYIGSNSDPIALQLTTGTTNPPPPNQPISGTTGTVTPDPNLPGVQRSTGIVLVDNEFAVPSARGCGLFTYGLINTLVNLQAGLPSPAGRNEAVQRANGSIAFIRFVYPPLGFEQ